MYRKNILGKVDADCDNAHDFPLLCGLDENVHFHLGTFDVVRGNFSAPSGRGSPFHSLGPIVMSNLQVAGGLLIGMLWLMPIVHIVKSQYWSSHAKAAWVVAFIFVNFFGYAIFLITTFRKSQQRNQASGIKENKLSSWFVWLLILIGNALLVFLWVAFSLAGAGSTIALGTKLGVAIPLLVSVYFMFKERYSIGLAWCASIMPFVLGFSIFLDLFNKP